MKTGCNLIILIALSLFSCEEVIQLDLSATPEKIVIEGLVTDRAGDQYVRITKTRDFYSENPIERVSNAEVTVTSSDGTVYEYEEVRFGYYVPVTNYTGKVGNFYRLRVQVDDLVYESEDQLLRVAPIDSLDYSLTLNPSDEQIKKGKLYDLLLYFKEPKDTEDYYFFKFFRNDTLTYSNPNDIYIVNDIVLSESIKGFPSPVYYAEQDTAFMEMYSLSREGYKYYSDLSNLQFNDGGLFGPVPANPRSNISNGALGFFQVSAVTSKEIILKKKN